MPLWDSLTWSPGLTLFAVGVAAFLAWRRRGGPLPAPDSDAGYAAVHDDDDEPPPSILERVGVALHCGLYFWPSLVALGIVLVPRAAWESLRNGLAQGSDLLLTFGLEAARVDHYHAAGEWWLTGRTLADAVLPAEVLPLGLLLALGLAVGRTTPPLRTPLLLASVPLWVALGGTLPVFVRAVRYTDAAGWVPYAAVGFLILSSHCLLCFARDALESWHERQLHDELDDGDA